MVKGKEQGYGQPLLATTSKKLVIRPFPSRGHTSRNAGVSLEANSFTSNKDSTTSAFKPKLSDIASSYFILKQNKPEQGIKSDDSSLSEQVPGTCSKRDRVRESIVKARVSFLRRSQESEESMTRRKPEPLREDLRQMLLSQARKKFQSKQFRSQSKFDKIEGLNWISWQQ